MDESTSNECIKWDSKGQSPQLMKFINQDTLNNHTSKVFVYQPGCYMCLLLAKGTSKEVSVLH